MLARPEQPSRAVNISLAPILAFAVLMATAMLIHETQGAQDRLGATLKSLAVYHWSEQSVTGQILAVVSAIAWFGWLATRPLIIFVAFLVVEILIVGQPKRWRDTLFALWIRVVIWAIIYLSIPWIDRICEHFRIDPLFKLDKSSFPNWMDPFTSPVLSILAIWVLSFFSYWLHRAQHKLVFLWKFHAIHHGIENLDSLNSYSHPLEPICERVLIFLISMLIGFEYDTVLWIMAFGMIHDRIAHTRAPIHLGWLGKHLVDNRYHFVHHSRLPEHYDKNFSPMFVMFDRWFGTYAKPASGQLSETGIVGKSTPKSTFHVLSGSLQNKT